MRDIMEYQNKWVLVTGAGKKGRVGAAIALFFARKGANIYLHYRSGKEEAEEVASAIREAGVEVMLVQGDLANGPQVERIFGEISPDIVINNAAVFAESRSDSLEALSAAFDANVDANMRAPYLVTHAAIARMRENSKKGVVVFVGDAFIEKNGVYAPNLVAYTLSKAYVPYVVAQFANALGNEGLRIFGVLNGPIEPPPSASPQAVAMIAREIPAPAEELEPWIGGERVGEVIHGLLQAGPAANGTCAYADAGRGWRTADEHA